MANLHESIQQGGMLPILNYLFKNLVQEEPGQTRDEDLDTYSKVGAQGEAEATEVQSQTCRVCAEENARTFPLASTQSCAIGCVRRHQHQLGLRQIVKRRPRNLHDLSFVYLIYCGTRSPRGAR